MKYTIDEEDNLQSASKQEDSPMNAPVDTDNLYTRIRAGETIAVRTKPVVDVNGVERGGECFSIQCEKTRWGFYVYSALRNGRRVKQMNRMILDTETARDWCAHLEEITEETQA